MRRANVVLTMDWDTSVKEEKKISEKTAALR